MPSHPFRRRYKRPFRGDVAILRQRFRQESQSAEEIDLAAYRLWLSEKGIDPDTGRMTPSGLAFFQDCLTQDRTRK
jgi:hypothetical protein